ncbi:hypothetical protein B0I37DRAFT_403510 [Chaetomium sp. MPI-CAGE-AT-0009]|nr:hypothetical protein B0I37DRAFT_403510 [Chaetomium sp. MPI-CAGE-AT-0009]
MGKCTKWQDMDEADRLPEGVRRTGYDEATQQYTFTNSEGEEFVGQPGRRFGEITRIGTVNRSATGPVALTPEPRQTRDGRASTFPVNLPAGSLRPQESLASFVTVYAESFDEESPSRTHLAPTPESPVRPSSSVYSSVSESSTRRRTSSTATPSLQQQGPSVPALKRTASIRRPMSAPAPRRGPFQPPSQAAPQARLHTPSPLRPVPSETGAQSPPPQYRESQGAPRAQREREPEPEPERDDHRTVRQLMEVLQAPGGETKVRQLLTLLQGTPGEDVRLQAALREVAGRYPPALVERLRGLLARCMTDRMPVEEMPSRLELEHELTGLERVVGEHLAQVRRLGETARLGQEPNLSARPVLGRQVTVGKAARELAYEEEG